MRCPGGLSVAVDRHRPRKLHLVAGIALALAGVLLWSGHAFGQEPPPSETSTFEPDFDHSACPYDLNVPSDVTLSCGFVTVLEDRSTLSGNTIDLYVVRSSRATPVSEPRPHYLPRGRSRRKRHEEDPAVHRRRAVFVYRTRSNSIRPARHRRLQAQVGMFRIPARLRRHSTPRSQPRR